jgi:hypothetical protein
MLVDGRNRRAACKIAGVTPEVRQLNGEDPTAFVLGRYFSACVASAYIKTTAILVRAMLEVVEIATWGRDIAARQGMLAIAGERIVLPHRQRPSALVLRRLLGRSATPAPLSTKFVDKPENAGRLLRHQLLRGNIASPSTAG